MCSALIGPNHRHLLEVARRQIHCACEPCAFRFQNVTEGRFKLIPPDVRWLPDFNMSDSLWESLALPINLVFFRHDTLMGKVAAMYPSPAGATESLLSTESWSGLAADNPVLTEMQPDIEALLVNRVGQNRDYFLVPMDVCFELTGRIRLNWRGLSGGEQVWQQVNDFFSGLRQKSDGSAVTAKEAALA